MAMTERQARHRVRELRQLYANIGWFIVINLFLAAINLATSPDSLWFYWVTIFWGFGIILQIVAVYSHTTWFGSDWEDKKVEQLTKN